MPSFKFLGIGRQSQSIPGPPQYWQSTRYQLCYFLVTGNAFAIPARWATSVEAATDSLLCHNDLLPVEKLMPDQAKEGQIKRVKMGKICAMGSSWRKVQQKTKEQASRWAPLLSISPMLFMSLPTHLTNPFCRLTPNTNRSSCKTGIKILEFKSLDDDSVQWHSLNSSPCLFIVARVARNHSNQTNWEGRIK